MADFLLPQPLTAEVFRPFGDVIETANRQSRQINQGYADRYENLVDLDLTDAGQPALSIFRARPISLPFAVSQLECHPQSSQAFIPKAEGQFLVLVAEPSGRPQISDLHLFVTNGQQGINYRRGVWHHFLMVLDEEQEFIVIDRDNPDENTKEFQLQAPCPIINASALSSVK